MFAFASIWILISPEVFNSAFLIASITSCSSALDNNSFVICGDEGINNVVADDFWDCTRDTIAEHFKKGNFKVGIVAGILNAGIQLKQFFPWQTDDENELSNEISKG